MTLLLDSISASPGNVVESNPKSICSRIDAKSGFTHSSEYPNGSIVLSVLEAEPVEVIDGLRK